MILDCYVVAQHCSVCAQERLKLRKNVKELKLFASTALLEYVALDLVGELIETKRSNRYLLVISDRYPKLENTVTLREI